MRIGVFVDPSLGSGSLEEMMGRVRAAAEAGFASAWLPQLGDWDALTAIAVIGREIPGIELGTAVVPTYPRHPMTLAGQALTVQVAIGNRLNLGIGPSHRFIIEDQFGYSFDRPARHIQEYLAVLGPLLRGERVAYEGETMKASGAVSVPGAAPPALLLAALGPAMLRLAGELTDGTITAWTGPATLASHVVPTITRAADAAGRARPRVIAGVLLTVTDDADAARGWVAERFGMAGETPSYRAMLDREGASGPADVVAAGDEAAVERELRRYLDAGATEILAMAFGAVEEQTRTMALLADLNRAGDAIGAAA